MLNVDRFEEYLAENRLIRHAWESHDERGRQTACWLAALSDEVAANQAAEYCPASDLPAWFAMLVPWMDDSVSESAWSGFARRLGATLRVHRSPEQWASLLRPALAVIVSDVLLHANDAMRPAIETVLTLLQRTAAVTREEWQSAAKEARRAAADVEVAAVAAAEAGWAAAEGWADVVARAVARAVGRQTRAAAADRITDGILRVLEAS